jgi:hypothetical protein
MRTFNQSGSHVIAIALVVAVLGVVGFAGYTVSHRNQKAAVTTRSESDKVPGAIKTRADLTATAHALDSASGDLNSSIDTSSLDSDMNDLL